MKKAVFRLLKNENGVNTVEIVIILAVLVTLAFVFKDYILELSNNIFDKITANTNKNIDSLNIIRIFIG